MEWYETECYQKYGEELENQERFCVLEGTESRECELEDDETTTCTHNICGNASWREYKATPLKEGGCQPMYQVRERAVTCVEWDEDGCCCKECGVVTTNSWIECRECPAEWNRAERCPDNLCEPEIWGVEEIYCYAGCKEEAPYDPSYYYNPLLPMNPFEPEEEKQRDPENIDLPVKLSWEDIDGWQEGWRDGGPLYSEGCVKDCPPPEDSQFWCPHEYPDRCYGEDLIDCKEKGKEECLQDMENFEWPVQPIDSSLEMGKTEVEGEFEYRKELEDSIKEEKDACIEEHRSEKKGCGVLCPITPTSVIIADDPLPEEMSFGEWWGSFDGPVVGFEAGGSYWNFNDYAEGFDENLSGHAASSFYEAGELPEGILSDEEVWEEWRDDSWEGEEMADSSYILLPEREWCFPPEDAYAQSHVLEIEGKMRDPETLKELETLKRALSNHDKWLLPGERSEYEERIEKIRKEELWIDEYTTIMNETGFVQPSPCMFLPGEEYEWRVKTCNDPYDAERYEWEKKIKDEIYRTGRVEEDEELEDVIDFCECGPWSNQEWSEEERDWIDEDWWKFETSYAPEPMSPTDPDWEGEERVVLRQGEMPEVEDTLINSLEMANPRWCEMTLPSQGEEDDHRPLSYKLLFFVLDIEVGEKECHHYFDRNGECEPFSFHLEEGVEQFRNLRVLNRAYDYFTKIHENEEMYAWQVAACYDERANDCEDLGQEWSFTIKEDLYPPSIIYPKDDPDGTSPTEIPLQIQWSDILGAHSYEYRIEKDGETVKEGTSTSTRSLFPSEEMETDAFYTTEVRSCWDTEGEKCEEEWSSPHKFRTAGEKPQEMEPEGYDIPIPTSFQWEEKEGARSYVLELRENDEKEELVKEIITEKESYVLDYPHLALENDYKWRVKSCATEGGENCGEWTNYIYFRTFTLPPPEEITPEYGEEIALERLPQSINIEWEEIEGANYYDYDLRHLGEGEECDPGEGITTSSSAGFLLPCPGEHEIELRSCLDDDCEEAGDSNTSRFSLEERETMTFSALVPCGRSVAIDEEDGGYPWDETDPCRPIHLLKLVKILIDFLLGFVLPIAFVLLVLFTGGVLYTSQGNPEAISRTRSIWRSFIIGTGIIILAFTAITLFMSVLGYEGGVWWQITF